MPDDALYGKSEYESNDATVFVMNIVSRIAVTSMSRHMTAAGAKPTRKAPDEPNPRIKKKNHINHTQRR
ncbi:MAG: hypothetical protein L0J14_06605, partial [Bifidobacterium crudilactis]|nr:hypothetical protein [Bifidobacterium crudilactis]